MREQESTAQRTSGLARTDEGFIVRKSGRNKAWRLEQQGAGKSGTNHTSNSAKGSRAEREGAVAATARAGARGGRRASGLL